MNLEEHFLFLEKRRAQEVGEMRSAILFGVIHRYVSG
jgi:hypothetical protein